MNSMVFRVAFAIGLLAVAWVAWGFVGTSALALVMTAVIAGVYGLGAFELKKFRAATASLSAALAGLTQAPAELGTWLEQVPASLRNPVRLRIEGERAALPGPALTPYLVGLLVMLGMLGTFLGMVVTFKGAVFALEGSTDLQAIRSALAEPIKGLGLAFGTSVAGVAASAMLGLLSALSRRERLEASRLLDNRIAGVLRPFSLNHQRQQTFGALQQQAQALPDLVDKLQALMEGLERRSQQLDTRLVDQQAQFHRDASQAYAELSRAVGSSLQDSLKAGARAAGESLKPVVEAAMTGIASESTRMHQRLFETTQMQLGGITDAFGSTAQKVSDGWALALQQHADTGAAQADRLDRTLAAFSSHFEQGASALLATVNRAASQSQTDQAAADQQRLNTWTQSLTSMAASLHSAWQTTAEQQRAQQQATAATLEQAANDISTRTSEQTRRTQEDLTRLLAQSEGLVNARIAAEADWTQRQAERMDQLAQLWRTEMGALRTDEATRGNAAVERLSELQAALATQLATLGQALEAPMTRLMTTAAEAPQAAAEVITQLRREMTRLGERDNAMLEERHGLVEQIGSLLQRLNQASVTQREAIDSLVAAAASQLDQAGDQFAATLSAQQAQAADMAVQLSGSASGLASLGASFNSGVELFSASNEKLTGSLQRIEDALSQSIARSDEQLAYYVAQAREVIDLSITAQQSLVEDLRRRDATQAGKKADKPAADRPGTPAPTEPVA